MNWSIKKLDNFYNTELGIKTKQTVQKEISKLISETNKINYTIGFFGYNITSNNTTNSSKDLYDFIISAHCEETGHCFKELTDFCQHNLKKDGYCILLTPNGNHEWKDNKTPFARFRTYKNIKALKMLNFKIIKKKPILYMTSEDNFIKRIFHKLFHFILPCKAAAHLIMARRFN